jgi:putative inorganic carbon (HCO3(-)) transporter
LQPATAKIDSETALTRTALWLAWACAVAVLCSIAASQILLGMTLVAVLVARTPLRLPRIWLPLALFMTGTVISLLLSGHMRGGLPQIKKFFVYLVLVVVFSTFHRILHVERLVMGWAALGGLTALDGLIQFVHKLHQAHQRGANFYDSYLGARITGFMSHWQTYGGELMIALVMLAAAVLFCPKVRGRLLWLAIAICGLLTAALFVGFTRGIWLGTACGGLYLLWSWKRRALLGLPVLLAFALWLNPGSARERIQSLFWPDERADSNQHRIVCWRTGWEMIKAHPWFGVGPERVGPDLMEYVPKDIPRPLPLGYYGHLHSIYIHYAAERGVPTMLALLLVLVTALWDFLLRLRRLPPGRGDEKWVLHGVVATLIALMVSGAFELNLGDSEVLTLFFVAVACGYVALKAAEGKGARVA